MKIFYIGKFNRFHSTENYVTYALRQLGVEVVKRQYTQTMNLQGLQRQIEKHSPDVILFSKASSPCFNELITWCRLKGILTVTWLWDLYWGYRPRKPVQFFADLLLTTDGGHKDRWKAIGVNHEVLRQGIHKPDHRMLSAPEFLAELAFVGSRNSCTQRRQLTRWLNFRFGDRIIWHTHTRGLELNQALAETKIVIGDSYPVDNYWSNRVYEILGRGGFLLFPETEGLNEEFVSGVHYVAYPRNNYKRLLEIVKYYLTNDSEREEIRRNGFEKCGEYTYEDRCRALLQRISAHSLQGA